MIENDLATTVIDHAMAIHKEYGPGMLERVYEEILFYELIEAGLSVERQKQISIQHKHLLIKDAFRCDLIIERKLLVELKSKEAIPPVDYRIALSYLRLANIRLGLVINFHSELLKDGIRRVINNHGYR